MAETLEDAARGLLLGTMVGDAMGMPVSGWSHDRIAATFGLLRGYVDGRLPAGTYTDETEMALSSAQSILEDRAFSPETAARNLVAFFTLWRGYDVDTCNVVSKLQSGLSWEESSAESFGAGPAVRVAPVAFFYADSPELKERARQCAHVTTYHPNAVVATVVFALAVEAALQAGMLAEGIEWPRLVRRLVEAAEGVELPEQSEAVARQVERLAELEFGPDLRARAGRIARVFVRDDSVVSAVPAALAALRAGRDFEETVVVAVNAGGPTDSIGALAGALAGVYYGASAIPEDLLDGLNLEDGGRDMAEDLGSRLAEAARRMPVGRLEEEVDL